MGDTRTVLVGEICARNAVACRMAKKTPNNLSRVCVCVCMCDFGLQCAKKYASRLSYLAIIACVACLSKSPSFPDIVTGSALELPVFSSWSIVWLWEGFR
jgi:hypothetical protein